jgi:hypothetical protein
MRALKKQNPLLTRNGRTKLGPLSLDKLTSMLDNARPRDKTKIKNRINLLKIRKGV